MPNRSKYQHDRPSATVLAEDKHFPGLQGQPIHICVDRWFLERNPSLTEQARALLSNDPDRCAELGALPPRYSHREPADFEEFFQPELSLATAETDPEWGFLEEPTDDQAALDAIAATVAELHRGFDHTQHMSPRLRFRLMAACREELRLQLAELELTTREPAPDVDALVRAAESLLTGKEPPAEDAQHFREWLESEDTAVLSTVQPSALESAIRATVEAIRSATTADALRGYRRELVGLLTVWQFSGGAA